MASLFRVGGGECPSVGSHVSRNPRAVALSSLMDHLLRHPQLFMSKVQKGGPFYLVVES